MSHWNHRIVLHKAGQLEENPDLKWEEYLAIHEVHYDDNGDPESATKDPISITGYDGNDSLIEIKWTLEQMLKATEKPILYFENLEEIEKEKQNEFSKSIKTKE